LVGGFFLIYCISNPAPTISKITSTNTPIAINAVSGSPSDGVVHRFWEVNVTSTLTGLPVDWVTAGTTVLQFVGNTSVPAAYNIILLKLTEEQEEFGKETMGNITPCQFVYFDCIIKVALLILTQPALITKEDGSTTVMVPPLMLTSEFGNDLVWVADRPEVSNELVWNWSWEEVEVNWGVLIEQEADIVITDFCAVVYTKTMICPLKVMEELVDCNVFTVISATVVCSFTIIKSINDWGDGSGLIKGWGDVGWGVTGWGGVGVTGWGW